MKEKSVPCSDGRYVLDWNREEESLRKELRVKKAMLCAILTVLDNHALLDSLYKIDEEESGVSTKQILTFWEKHKTEDKIRREREMKKLTDKIKRDALLSQALFKLTKEEKEVLGVKL
jgi:hypothetical protein